MKWLDATKNKPKHGSYILVWNMIKQRQELMICNWVDGDWDVSKMSLEYARMWAYVFEEQ